MSCNLESCFAGACGTCNIQGAELIAAPFSEYRNIESSNLSVIGHSSLFSGHKKTGSFAEMLSRKKTGGFEPSVLIPEIGCEDQS
jgi:hypothetical protein